MKTICIHMSLMLIENRIYCIIEVIDKKSLNNQYNAIVKIEHSYTTIDRINQLSHKTITLSRQYR